MLLRMKASLGRINYKLFFALLVLGLCPTIYATVRVFLLGQLPDGWAYSIAGQLSWVNLIYEIVNEAIILPLFYFMGAVKENKQEYRNRVRTGIMSVVGVYVLLALIIICAAEELLYLMAADVSIVKASAAYIRIESIANIFSVIAQFSLIVLVTLNKSNYLYILTGVKLILCLLSDIFMVSSLPVSLNLGVNGIGYSDILVNALITAVSLLLLYKEKIRFFTREKMNFGWVKEFVKVGSISGAESLVRNVAYMVMIARMVNVVGEQGTYWVANNFIWGWLLLPVLQLGELIKQEVASDKENVARNSPGYFTVTAMILIIWLVSIPVWKPFMTHVLGFDDVDKLIGLVLLLLGFYALYAFQNVFDAILYGLGKTNYLLFQSLVTNGVYYGAAFALYATGVWTPTLTGIALLFGIGNAFDSIVSFGTYLYYRRRQISTRN